MAESDSNIEINRLMRLKAQLSRETTSEVRFDGATRAAYGSEASNYRQLPIGVVVPKTIEDLVKSIGACEKEDLPILARGAGTSMCGQSVNAAVIIDHSKYLHAIVCVDAQTRIATVEPGVVCDQLKGEAAKIGLTFGPDPATHSRCTLGGMIGNNSCGAHSVMAGKTVENIERLEILTYEGERFWVGPTDQTGYEDHVRAGGKRAAIVKALKDLADLYADDIRQGFPKLKRRVSGYNLDQLLPENGFNIARALVGTEGTCVTVLQAQTRLVTNPAKRALVVLGFPDIFLAADSVPQLLPLGPIAMEGIDEGIIGGLRERKLKLDDIAELPSGEAWIMVEVGADDEAAVLQAANRFQAIAGSLPGTPSVRVVADASLMNRIWAIRETGASATSLALDPSEVDPVVGWEDAAVEPAMLGKYLREFSELVKRYGYKTNLYGHFGDGCVHSRITFDLKSHEGISHWRKFLVEAAHLVVKYGGSLSGEHGDGQAKGEFLPIMYSANIMQAFVAFKKIWDPRNRMNPGKLIDAMPADANLRLGPDHERKAVDSPFSYYGNLGDLGFARATERCIGMGKCRSMEGGTMCPSFRATHEELYSTRGRARLFFEMLKGEVITDGWDNESLKDSLDLCLACKGCKTDCPTHVDVARYKSEFLWRHYAKKRRPIAEEAVGRIGQWLPLATRVAPLLNGLMKSKSFRSLAGRFGLAPFAKFPSVAATNFRRSMTGRRLAEATQATRHRSVVLWTDSFNNAFSPQVLEAGVTVLEHFGFRVQIMTRHVCCGRPFYDAGMLDEARANLTRIMAQMAPALESALPIVVLEPSCLSVFRDELPALFPNDQRASQLSGAVQTFAEFLVKENVTLPLSSQVPHIHGHCHQKACGGMAGEVTLLKQLGMGHLIESGCCGMAGAYGYNSKTAEIGEKIGREQWAPRLSNVPATDALIADGFSCRSQASNLTGRRPLHIAEWLAQIVRSSDPTS